jgi:signal transduction histidine kinase
MSDVSHLLGVLAHEMRTPLAAILGYEELLAEGIYGTVDDRGKEGLHRIAYCAHQLLHLIDGVQDISAPPEKQHSSQTVAFAPRELLESCLADARADATGRSVQLQSDLGTDLPSISGDPERFSRAIDLALSAAIKTTHAGKLSVQTRGTETHVAFIIEGTGLTSKDNPDFLFPGRGDLTGAGLRLAIVREIARQMNGDLELHPEGPSTTLVILFGVK